MKLKFHLLFVVCLFLVAFLALPTCYAQSTAPEPAAPSSLPGYSVSMFAGYSATTGNQTNNGFFSSVAVPVYLFSNAIGKKYDMSLALRGDYFSITTPSTYVLTGGPEFRFQFSRSTLLNGQAFQPFANVGIGIARSSCVSTSTCPAGADTSSHAAFKIGGGLDVPLNSAVTMRIIEVDLIHSTLFPTGNVVITNAAQISAGIGLRF